MMSVEAVMADRLPVQRTIPVTEVRSKLSQLLKRVNHRDEHVVVEKLGVPVAAIISMREYEQFRRLLARHQLTELGRKVGAEADRQGLTEDQLREDLAVTRKALFREKYSETGR
jgi:prevent-host-death family protein